MGERGNPRATAVLLLCTEPKLLVYGLRLGLREAWFVGRCLALCPQLRIVWIRRSPEDAELEAALARGARLLSPSRALYPAEPEALLRGTR